MENVFIQKNFVQKLIIAVVFILLFNFASPTVCNAKGFLADLGGKLLMPVMELIMYLADGVLGLLQTNLLTDIGILQPASSNDFKNTKKGVLKWVVAGLLIVVAAVAIVATWGAAAPAVGAAWAGASGFVATAGAVLTALAGVKGAVVTGIIVVGVCGVGAYKHVVSGIKDFKGEFDIPTIVYTPFIIFSGMVPMFDINFFAPKSSETMVVSMADLLGDVGTVTVWGEDPDWYNYSNIESAAYYGVENIESDVKDLVKYVQEIDPNACKYIKISSDGRIENSNINLNDDRKWLAATYPDYQAGDSDSDKNIERYYIACYSAKMVGKEACKVMFYSMYEQDSATALQAKYDPIDRILAKWTKEKIIEVNRGMGGLTCSGIQAMLIRVCNVTLDIPQEKSVEYGASFSTGLAFLYNTGKNNNATADQFWSYLGSDTGNPVVHQGTIGDVFSNMDVDVLNFIESGGNKMDKPEHQVKDTAKKSAAQVLQKTVAKWYVSLRNLALVALLVILVYIGIRIVLSSTAPEKAKYKEMIINWAVAICILFLLHIIMITILNVSESITKGLTGNCAENIIIELPNKTVLANSKGDYPDENRLDDPAVFNSNFVGLIRYKAGICTTDESDITTIEGIGFILMYIMLVVQTCMFSWTYGKRVVYMAFLTIIAPLVAITYPIDKIGDGKSQAFDMWLKEYIFNALLQPIHLLIYTVLCGTAMDLMIESPIYGIIVLGFMVPAEKFIRKMFGFEKAQTPGALGGAVGLGLAMTGMQRLGGMLKGDDKNEKVEDQTPKIRMNSPEEQRDHNQIVSDARNRVAIGTGGGNNPPPAGGNNPPPAGGNNPPPAGGDNPPPVGGDNTPPVGEDDLPTAEDFNNGEQLTLGFDEEFRAEQQGMPAVDENTDPVAQQIAAADEIAAAAAARDAAEAGNDDEVQEAVRQGQHAGNDQNEPQGQGEAGGNAQHRVVQPENRSRGRRLVSAMTELGRYQNTRIRRNFTPRKIRRFGRKTARKFVGGVFGAGTALAMAAARMAAGSNASDVINSSIAAGAAGAVLGNKGMQFAQNVVNEEGTIDALDRGWYTGEERRERLNARAIREMRNNPDFYGVFDESGDLYGYNGRQVMNSTFTERGLRMGLNADDINAAYANMISDDFRGKYGGLDHYAQEAMALQIAQDSKKDYLDPKIADDFLKTRPGQLKRNSSVQDAAAEAQRTAVAEADTQMAAAQQSYDSALQTAIDADPGGELAQTKREIEDEMSRIAQLGRQYNTDETRLAQEIQDLDAQIKRLDQEADTQQSQIFAQASSSARDEAMRQQAQDALIQKQSIEEQIKAARREKRHDQVRQLEAQKRTMQRDHEDLMQRLRNQGDDLQRMVDDRTSRMEAGQRARTTRRERAGQQSQFTAVRGRIQAVQTRQDALMRDAGQGQVVDNLIAARKRKDAVAKRTADDFLDDVAKQMAQSELDDRQGHIIMRGNIGG